MKHKIEFKWHWLKQRVTYVESRELSGFSRLDRMKGTKRVLSETAAVWAKQGWGYLPLWQMAGERE